MINQIHSGNYFPEIKYKNNIAQGFQGNSGTQNKLSFSSSNSFTNKMIAKKIKETGDKEANNHNFKKAIYLYEKAIEKKPDYDAPYYNLAKAHEKNGNFNQVINTYERLLKVKPKEVEAMTLMGNCYKQKGNFEQSKQMYEKAVEIDPKYDFAARNLKEVKYLILNKKNPHKAEILKKQISDKNLNKALLLVNQHASPKLSRVLEKLNIVFNETDSLSGHKNIAQYEHHNKKIVVTSEYIWAAPEVTAAYIIHEAVHAHDNDGLSSIMEEQDAYEESIEFWVDHNNGIKDPELDYAAKLHRENPEKLRQKVGETYKSRDSSMPEYSPYHTPLKKVGLLTNIKIQALKLRSKICNMIGLA